MKSHVWIGQMGKIAMTSTVFCSSDGFYDFQYVASSRERQEEKENEIKTENQEDGPAGPVWLY